MSSQLFSPHLTSSHPISFLLSISQLCSAAHNCSLLFSCHLSFSHLFSSHLSFFSDSELFSTLLSSHRSCQLILCLLVNSLLFSHLLSSAHISSADLSSCQLVSPHQLFPRHSQIIQLFSDPRPAPKMDLGAKGERPLRFLQMIWHREAFAHESPYIPKHLNTEGHRSFYAQTPLHTVSFYTREAFTYSKPLEKPLQSFYTARLHTERPLDRKVYTDRVAFTHSKFFNWENLATNHYGTMATWMQLP